VSAGLIKTIAFIIVSPLLGFILGSLMMLLVSWLFVRSTPMKVDKWFRRLQLISASMYSLGHGGNDAQKTMGIIWMLLIAGGYSSTMMLCRHGGSFCPVIPRSVLAPCLVAGVL
jgi:PiT family inorganic phosphate transporter